MAKTLFYQNSLHRDFSFNTFTSSELVFPAACELSLVTVRGAALQSQPQASRCSGFSCCEAWAPELGLSSCGAPGSLPGQGCAGASHSGRWEASQARAALEPHTLAGGLVLNHRTTGVPRDSGFTLNIILSKIPLL